MTQEEKDYCECCGIHDSCAYVSRGLQRKCEKLDIFAVGMEAAIAKASLWLETEWARGAQSAEIIGQFEEAMKGD